jgi:hypothetical protein
MTPFRNDEGNPFGRESAWPTMPQTPLLIDGVAPVRIAPAAWPAVAELRPPQRPSQPLQAPVLRRRELRLTPLIAAGAVGVGGLLALFLMIGVAPPPKVAAPAPPPLSALSVGELVTTPSAPSAPAATAP